MEKCISTVLNNPPTEEDGEQCTPLVDVVSLLRTFYYVDTVGMPLETLETLILHSCCYNYFQKGLRHSWS